jgi:hypothetical protein
MTASEEPFNQDVIVRTVENLATGAVLLRCFP